MSGGCVLEGAMAFEYDRLIHDGVPVPPVFSWKMRGGCIKDYERARE